MLSVDPSLTAVEVKQILESTARKIGDPNSYVNGHSSYFGYGCVDAEAAIEAVLARNIPVGKAVANHKPSKRQAGKQPAKVS